MRLLNTRASATLALTMTLLLTLPLNGRPATRAQAAAGLIYTQAPCVPVSIAPSSSAPLITQLLGGTDVTLVGTASGWSHIRIWSGLDGYAPASALGAAPPARADEGDCTLPGVADAKVDILPSEPGPFPLRAGGWTLGPATLYAWPAANALPVAGLRSGAKLAVSEWASDSAGRPWYHVTSSAGSGWLWAGDGRLAEPDPATRIVNGKPVWEPVAGKGMWFTNYFTRHADVNQIVAAAKAAGLTHIYAEVAITRYGFYAPVSLDRLLPAAHAQGIAVIAWVYPTLDNIAADIRMTLRVARYVTPSGDRPDGLATDIEEVTDSGSVYAYGQVLRGVLGPDALMVNSAMHPFTHPDYPYAAIAASWNVMAPMDYWHSSRRHGYSAASVARFVTGSIVTIRAAMLAAGVSRPIPIEELGQMYDMYSNDGAGVGHNPTGAEITADLRAARALDCIGASYFEWQTATQAQWQALTAFAWPR
ncbi:MAG TPA: SH3 domain-containing protein [Ktedonobacterales bacterium]